MNPVLVGKNAESSSKETDSLGVPILKSATVWGRHGNGAQKGMEMKTLFFFYLFIFLLPVMVMMPEPVEEKNIVDEESLGLRSGFDFPKNYESLAASTHDCSPFD